MKDRRVALITLSIVLLGILLTACAQSGAGEEARSPDRKAASAALHRAEAELDGSAPAHAVAPALLSSSASQAPAPSGAPGVQALRAAPAGGDRYGYSTGGSATVNDAPYDAMFFNHYGVNPFIDTEDDHLSTFAMDVDTASYTIARRFVQDGHLPNSDAVRVEEFVNFFDQGYESPQEDAFSIHVEGSPSPFGGKNHWLMRVGLQGRTVTAVERKDASLIFVIDTSGSMARGDRLGLVKRSLRLLIGQLRPTDEVGIVLYGSHGRVLLEPTSGDDRGAIVEAVEALRSEGSTNAAEGLILGYKMALARARPGRITRVVLLSDGVANVGRTGHDSILDLVRTAVEEEVTLSTVGFGMGNYNDVLMEQLANDGNGNYSYIDTLREAQRIFVENLTGTLQLIARDAKVQVDFNPDVVSRYRLIGYENRRVAHRDFRNDSVDAGEVGAGHSVTALYELKLREGIQGLVGTVSIRYEDPDSYEVLEVSREFDRSELAPEFQQTSPRFQLAATVVEYAEILRESYWAQDGSLAEVASMADRVGSLLADDPDAVEFAQLVKRAAAVQSLRVQVQGRGRLPVSP